MEDKKFDELWEQIGNIAQDIINTCDDGTYFNNEKKMYIFYEYNKNKDLCKDKHMVGSIKNSRLDRHKVASCIAGAIISAKPLEKSSLTNSNSKKISYLANETLAVFTSLAIVKSFIRSDIKNEEKLDIELKNEFLKNGYIFPIPAHDDYLPWLLYLLQESSIIGFNILSFSNILYLIECYTFAKLEIQKIKTH